MAKTCFGVDIGGTTIKLGMFDLAGNILDKWEIPTRKEDNGDHILEDAADSIQKKMKEHNVAENEVEGVGVGVPGPVDKDGMIYGAANLGWNTFNIKDRMESILHVPVAAGNDANVAALGEMWKGGGKGYQDMVLVTLGTGIGGGIIIGGNIITGSLGSAGEIGHMHIQDGEKETCGCGKKGCLEQYGSAEGIARLARRKLAATDKETILRGQDISAKTVFDAVKQKDAVALEIAEEFGVYLGKGLAAVACVVDPQAFVIGGGVSKAGEILTEYIRKNYEKYVFKGCRNAKFVLATLGNDAGIYGAAKLILK